MPARSLSRALAGALLALACHAQDARPAPQLRRPNILLVLLDDVGYSDLGCYGSEIPTPNLDALAAAGVRFEACGTSARCCPTRAALLTGLHPHQAGVGSFATERPDRERGPAYLGHLSDRCVTLAEVLRSAGYATYMVGKWHVGLPGPTERGFDEFYGFTRGYEQDQWQPGRYERLPEGRQPELRWADGEFYATDAFTDYALEFLRQARSKPGDKPWFLYLAHSAAHFPVQAPPASTARFVDTYRSGWDLLRAARFARQQESGLATGSWTLPGRSIVPVDRADIANGYPGQPNPAWASLPEPRREDLAHRMAIFAAMVSHVDRGIGRLTADLRAHGELTNTLILVLSDNGACYEWGPYGFDGPSRRGETKLHEAAELARMGGPGTYHAYGSAWANLGNTPFRLYKHFTHEGGISSPLIAHWPAGGARRGDWVRDPVHVVDVMPTLCEVAGADYPDEWQGQPVQPAEGVSLVPALRGEPLPERSLAYEHQQARALRRGRYKVVYGKRRPEPARWELYDLEEDRCEARDLADERPELVVELAAEWRAWARRVGVHPFWQEGRGKVETPQIAGRALAIRCRVVDGKGDGVLLAHGGNRHGYALHIEGDEVVFSVRRAGVVATVRAPRPVAPFPVNAFLEGDGTMRLRVGEGDEQTGKAGGVIAEQPTDELSVGRDSRSAVGEYESPFPFAGEVAEVRVEAR